MYSYVLELLKLAAIKTELLPHQERLLNRIEKQPGLLVVHGLGAGKSLSSIAIQDHLGLPATVIVPASLKENYKKERDKHLEKGTEKSIEMDTIQNIGLKGKVKINPLLIVDEAHKLRDPSSSALKALKESKRDKTVLLTATPFYNHPSDISTLLNLVAQNKILPEEKKEFEKEFISNEKINPSFFKSLLGITPGEREVINPKNRKKLKSIFDTWIDYHPSTKEHFPDVVEEFHKVPMTKEQQQIYDTVMDEAPFWVRMKVRDNLPPSKKETNLVNKYLNITRQISNTSEGFDKKQNQPKIDYAFNKLKEHFKENEEGKALIYSNFLESGIQPYKKLLESEGISHLEFTGKMTEKQKKQAIEDYNSGRIKVLLLSSAGSEGLDTKKTSLVQILEPHWNNEKIEQVKGRAIRYKSHDGLPKEKQRVIVQRFLAIKPREGLAKWIDPGAGTDEYLETLSKNKDELNKQFKQLLEKTSTIKDDVSNFLASDTKNWNQFNQNLSKTKFTKELLSRELDPDFKNYIQNISKHNKAKNGIQIQGTKLYTIKNHKDGTKTCDCPDYVYKRAPKNEQCKHIKSLEKTAEVKPLQQLRDFSCSAASLRAVLQHYGLEKSEEELIELIGAQPKRGAEWDQIVRAAEKLGFEAKAKSLSILELEQYLKEGIPLIANVKSYTKAYSGHWLVLAGIKDDKVQIMDPNVKGNWREEKWEKFLPRFWDWSMYDKDKILHRWCVIVLPKNL